MKSIAIFGCGAAGQGAAIHLKPKYRIVSFLDNDPRKQGARVQGVKVRDPKTYDYHKVDHVFIASMYLDEILVQLLELGVPSSKIEYISQEIALKNPPSVLPEWAGLHILRRAFFIPFRLLRRAERKRCHA